MGKAAWRLSADVNYVGKMSAKDDFTQPCTFEQQGYANLCGNIGSFTTVNLGGSYSGLMKNLKLSFAIRNLFDTMPPFAPSATSSQAVAASSLHSTVGRYFMLTADYKFK
jgi:iron complex outermembrane receptor protein